MNKYNIELNKTNAMRATGIVATSHQTFCMKISVSKIALSSAFNYRLYTSQARSRSVEWYLWNKLYTSVPVTNNDLHLSSYFYMSIYKNGPPSYLLNFIFVTNLFVR